MLKGTVVQASLHYGSELSEEGYSEKSNRNVITTEVMRNRHKKNQEFERTTRLASRLTRLLEVLPGGVIVLNGGGVIQQSNLAAIELLGSNLEGQKWSQVIQRAFEPQENDGHDVSLKDGRLLHITTSPLDGEPGQIVLLQDVTETHNLQLKISHLQRLSTMGEMAARLAHQIRTPLSSALLFLAPLLKEDTDVKLRQRFAKRLHDSISHMEQLVKDMLAFSRGDMTATSPVEIDALLKNVQQQFFSQPESKEIHFEIQNTLKDAYIYGCKEALASAINNLVNNARLACENKGEIIIFVEQVQDDDDLTCIEISVEDNGYGIAEDDQDKVLTPFFTTRSSGTGLGLAVVQSIVKAHKGELWFESDEGEGSTFCMRLPRYQPADSFTLKP
ncbi:MAG: PAS domain-containing sensor histidine kinase [Methylophaga sp.]|nr:MAG: PAS domain-containing sensor histidine kinase [Methylophaga sp.]